MLMVSKPMPPPVERRSRQPRDPGDVWTSAQRDIWRTEAFKMQIAEEAEQRRSAAQMRRAVWFGMALGLAGCGLSMLWG